MEVARRGLAYLLLALGVCSISPTGASGAWNPLFRGAQLLDVGHWTASSAYRAGGPNGLAAGDLNADGRPDLVVVNRNDSIPPQVGKTVSVLLHSSDSNASSPFLPKVNYPTLNKPCAVELADMNLDGALDAVVRTGGDLYVGEADSVCVMLGTGTGSFGPPVSGTNLAIRNSEWWGRGLVLADVNQDGWTDVLAPGSDSSGEPKIAVLLGSAAGLTTLVLHAATPPSPYATNGMAVGDLTGDFILDVVAVGSFGATLLQGNGSGGFSYVKHLLPGGDEVLHAVIVDLNGDDLMDVVLSQSGAAGPHILSFVATGGGNFLAPESYSLGALDAFELGDLDLDGKLDLVATGISDPWVRVLRGDGDGTFQEDDDLYAPAHQWTGDLRLVDVNGNGRLDLVGASPYPLDNRLHTISLILDDGAGGFSEPQITPFSSSVFYQALADFDKNGTLDVAVAKSSGIGIGLGQGDGTFVEVPGGPASGASTIVTGDWNWDGRPDIAFQSGTAIEFHYTLYTFGFLNFTPAFGMPGQTLHRRSVADMNRDGRPDLVVTDVNVVRVHTQNEDGTYFPNAPQNVIGDVRSLAPGDWNRDGITDVVVTTTSGALLLLGNGDGTLGPPKLVSPASRIYADLCIGDFNRDGRPDLAMLEAKCGQSGTRGIDVLLGDGAGGFLGAPSVPTLEQNGYRLESWDVNVDGYPDLVASGLPDPALDPWPFDDPPPASVEVHLGEGTGRFDPPLAYSLGQPHSSSSNPTPHFAVGDVNRDGEPDIVSVHDVSVRSLLETPPDFGNALGPRVDYPTSAGTRRIAAGDLNRDGILDVVTASTSNLASVRLGTRPGTLGPATTVTQSFAALEVDLADVNRDGKLDLLCVGTTEVLTCMLGNGDGTFGPRIDNTTLRVFDFAVGDMNRDGRPDLVIARYDPGTRYVQILLGTMGGTFTAGGPQFAIPGTGIYDIEILDVGGDDVPDIVLATGGLYVVYGNGAGGFSFGYAVNVGSTTVQTVCSADFDQDGTMDVAVSDLNSALKVAWGSANPPFSTYVSSATPGSGWDLQTGRAERDGRQFLYLSTSGLNQVAVMQPGGTPGSFTTAATYATGGDPEELVLGDLNRDGLLDVFTANSATGNISVFAGSSTLVTGVSSSPVAPSTRLEQNAPNPFNPRTTIRFSVAEPGAVRLDVYDVQGRHVSTLVDGMIAAGDHAVPWDGRSDSGSSAASGVYFYRLRTASGESESRRMVMVR